MVENRENLQNYAFTHRRLCPILGQILSYFTRWSTRNFPTISTTQLGDQKLVIWPISHKF